ncbi:MAG: 1-deoxy-D-xylulose-5-phosphate synthase [Clostridiales bacterium]|nr:1-deoxy-D-xylulose-5-phosphate synthase [Clostridiales bacterium]
MDNANNPLGKSLLEGINSPDDVKRLSPVELERLAQEIRDFLIENISVTGGHLASNLGVVELTLALHSVFSTPEDKIIWDVGHQSYVHKIITGRKRSFGTLRQLNGISGFPKTSESPHDAFNTGHSSTSISAALGMAKARDIKNGKYSVVAVIGDGALTGGMSFEALNDAGRSPNNLIVVLNDNEMSISKNVGGLSRYLSKIRTQPIYSRAKEDLGTILSRLPAIGKTAAKALEAAKGTIKYLIMPGMIFEELGFKYLGPIDGHNLVELSEVFSNARRQKGPVLIHVCTQKGKGYSFAEEKPDEFHGISPFEVETGELKSNKKPSFSDVFGSKLVSLAEKNGDIVAITAAMRDGTGLNEFSKRFPTRFFDVGIAEQHAVTFSAGLAQSGLRPVVAIYSSFLQRSYDQILHDVALQKLPVVFAVDRAGIVGEDGETHQGIYDLSFLNNIPNISIMTPCDYCELELMLEYSLTQTNGPVAIRYPRGSSNYCAGFDEPVTSGQCIRLVEGTDVTILAAGTMLEIAVEAAETIRNAGYSPEILYARFVKPLDEGTIMASAEKTGFVATLEDNTVAGGFGSSVLNMLNSKGSTAEVLIAGFPDSPVAAVRGELRQATGKITAHLLSRFRAAARLDAPETS